MHETFLVHGRRKGSKNGIRLFQDKNGNYTDRGREEHRIAEALRTGRDPFPEDDSFETASKNFDSAAKDFDDFARDYELTDLDRARNKLDDVSSDINKFIHDQDEQDRLDMDINEMQKLTYDLKNTSRNMKNDKEGSKEKNDGSKEKSDGPKNESNDSKNESSNKNDDYDKTHDNKSIEDMSTEELIKRNQRLTQEKRYRELTAKKEGPSRSEEAMKGLQTAVSGYEKIAGSFKKIKDAKQIRERNARVNQAISEMSDDDIRRAVARINLEKTYRDALRSSTVNEGRSSALEMITLLGGIITVTGGLSAVYKSLKED